jgi:hypothetical protein
VGDRRVVDAVADRRSQVSPPPATLPSLQGLVRLGLARLGSIFFSGPMGCKFSSGSSTGGKDPKKPDFEMGPA